MTPHALTKLQKQARISRLYGEGKLDFKTYHELLTPLFTK